VEGVGDLARGIEFYRQTGARNMEPYWLLLLADARRATGHLDDALRAISEAQAAEDRTHEEFVAPELFRMHGDLLRSLSRFDEAVAVTNLAVERAEAQGARHWVVRAARQLSELTRARDRSPLAGGRTPAPEGAASRTAASHPRSHTPPTRSSP
jgi:hypothetical protein